MNIGVDSMPLEATLKAKVSTTNEYIDARFPDTYEGEFDVHTTNQSPIIHADTKKRDPAGKGRKPEFVFFSRGSSVIGSKFWDRKNADKGQLEIRTTNAPVSVHL